MSMWLFLNGFTYTHVTLNVFYLSTLLHRETVQSTEILESHHGVNVDSMEPVKKFFKLNNLLTKMLKSNKYF